MSKSRNGGSEGSRSNSVECDEANQQQINIQSLVNSASRPETPGTENDSLAVGVDRIVADSAPPSYEHAIEETRLAQYASNPLDHKGEDREKEKKEEEEEEDQEEEGEDSRGDDKKQSEEERNPEGGGPGGGGNSQRRTPVKGPEILHKSSKELYRAVAKQWGITCKMSDRCRCFDCQGRYFDCDNERDQQQKSDGGLGTITPVYLSEVMHGTACLLL
ncbi:zinc finger and BTB domain-containing protein 4 [Cephus cinctus]|uniref:Zinc finger and BTB domain-containing protein 4 n=1 Tax=Cephus cinctus TaxID=211228 RepID=A0AAJ7BXX0_CEPCN|nr:zinc finger and BTB domain-containing protein 4 [Cephus cinctus]XP_015596649.1 zinc finger and BTB domain-containing protein 4 [Cephus cinctus]